MGEKEDKEKAEKLAAAKKRVAQLQKKKKAGEKGGPAKKAKDAAKPAEKEDVGETPQSPVKADVDADAAEAVEDIDPTAEVKGADKVEEEEDDDAVTAAFDEAIKSASQDSKEGEDEQEGSVSPRGMTASPSGELSSSKSRRPGRQASVSLQSKMRSASFRQGAGPTSPAADDDFPDIYRKQMARIEELEKENKRLAKEAQESQSRWQKNEDELEELREKAAEDTKPDGSEEVAKLKSEIETLRRNSRQSISVPKQKPDEDVENLRKQIESKEATIGDMQLEISRLRSQASALTESGRNENEQIAALQDSLQRSEAANGKMQIELTDVKKALNRASEKAVTDGTEKTSRETKIKALERELGEIKSGCEESDKKAETLEKKIEAMHKLHREAEQRNAPKLAQADAGAKELQMIKAKLEAVEKENLRLREARKSQVSGEGGDEGLEELEDEERQKFERKIRELEGENFDLRRGVWRDRRKELQPNLSLDQDAAGDDFDEVDLDGSGAPTRKSSTMHPPSAQAKHSGFAQVFNSGLAAFRASTTSPDSQQRTQNRPRNDSLLEDFDDEAFDEGAFATAQREEEMRKMVEHVREVKKGLKQWQGWRLDLVDLRRSGGGGVGFGEIFEV